MYGIARSLGVSSMQRWKPRLSESLTRVKAKGMHEINICVFITSLSSLSPLSKVSPVKGTSLVKYKTLLQSLPRITIGDSSFEWNSMRM